MEDDVEHLWRHLEWPGDRKLVALARIWKATNKANTLAHDHEVVSTSKTSAEIYVHILQASLEQVRSGIPSDLLDDKIVLTHFYSAQVLNYEIALSLPASDVISANDFRRLDYLFLLLQATRSLLDTYLSLTLSEVVGYSMSLIRQVIRGLSVLYNLSAIEDGAWDPSTSRRPADVLAYFEQLVNRMGRAHMKLKSASGMGRDESSCFSKSVDCWNSGMPRWVEALARSSVAPDQRSCQR
ncbi:hypothetical protein K491DRAFT_778084 [Lophiostoma macrostomum CBS 122681]|uniref:Uncharacterized protein n=1 Tax=Lophiostoma macrostomum CBS 122681 TaxID=1314788 RepID=A0A6A6T9D4_9PLEO|nr:hypothetical protein K491DRAFT_778084 [Lophiostoma macrostomum CBS 122681]